jgi:hypothetical protein
MSGPTAAYRCGTRLAEIRLESHIFMARQIGPLRAWAEFAAWAPPWALLRSLLLERAVRVGAAMGLAASAFDRHNRSIARRNIAIATAATQGPRRPANVLIQRLRASCLRAAATSAERAPSTSVMSRK